MTGHAKHFRRQQGLSLVEVMVGLTVGMLLVAGLALMFGSASRSSHELERSVRHIENGRYAMDWLTQDLSMAGYYGTVPVVARAALSSPCLDMAGLDGELDAMRTMVDPKLPFAVQGLTSTDAQSMTVLPNGCMPNHRLGTPALVVRRLDPAAVAPGSATDGAVYIQASHYIPDNTETYISSRINADFTYKDRNANTNVVRRFVSRIYYIANCSDCSNGGDGVPTLTVSELTTTGFRISAIAEGIEQIGFDFGFDTAGSDGNPDEWYGLNGSANAAEAAVAIGKGWESVMAVKVSLISRAVEASPGYTDTRIYPAGLEGASNYKFEPNMDAALRSFKRRAYVGTVRLNTPAGLRERP